MKKEQKSYPWYSATSSDLLRADEITSKIIETQSEKGLRWLCALCYLAGEAQINNKKKKGGNDMAKSKKTRNPYATNRAGLIKSTNTPDTEKIRSSKISGSGDLRTNKNGK